MWIINDKLCNNWALTFFYLEVLKIIYDSPVHLNRYVGKKYKTILTHNYPQIVFQFENKHLKTSKWITLFNRNLLFRVKSLICSGIKLVFVADGTPPELKRNTIKKRLGFRLVEIFNFWKNT